MTTISPPPGLPPAALPPTSQTPVLATVPDPPNAVAGALVGTIITGTVVGRDVRGLVAIRTDNGTLALATQANLPTGSTVALEVRVAGARMQLIVLSVNPPPGPGRTAAPGAAPPTAAGGAFAPLSAPAGHAAPAPAVLSVGGLVTASVTQPAPSKPGAARRRDGIA
ncbi:MAG TPA: hypothetical protein VJJ77_06645, partial [Dongiaceae bacterium]|nr:hypothetical protein [Dongiaceae bacterium]